MNVNVRHQIYEETAQVDFYRGIYTVSLNREEVALFVPTFERTPENWPPVLPDNLDALPSAQEARLYSTALSRYTVTPDVGCAGQQEVFEKEAFEEDLIKWEGGAAAPREGVLFFVTPEEFETFQQELEAVSAETFSIYSGVPLSDVMDCQFIRYLLAQVLCDPYFSAGDWESMARGSK